MKKGIFCIAAITLGVALFWAGSRDPFTRIKFSLRTAGAGKTQGMVVLPKPAARSPAVVFLHGSGGSVAASGKILRQMAELGCAAVAIEYSQTNQSHFNEQLAALHQYLLKAPWGQSNAVAWVGFSLGAQRSLTFLLTHPEVQPQLYVRVGGGLVDDLKAGPVHANPLRCPVLLVHGEQDEAFPVTDCHKLAEMLRTNHVAVETRILPGQPHAFGDNMHVVMRAVAEYCLNHLPLADYAGTLAGCDLSDAERKSFNQAMCRAGANRRVLWKAVAGSREPQRRTAMKLVSALEDYDLAHISAGHLQEITDVAWQARRSYPWCRNMPLEVFETFTVAPRVFEEPLAQLQSGFSHRLSRDLKYCRSTSEASDAIYRWTQWRATWSSLPLPAESTPADVLARRGGDCRDLVALFIYLSRSAGIAARPVTTTWPTLGSSHYWAEIWDAEKGAWHACDASAASRPYNANWVTNVPKAATHAPGARRGVWNAEREGRWEAYTNTVGLFYPSGTVQVRVVDHAAPKANQRVNVQVWLKQAVVLETSSVTDEQGMVWFTLGQSARQPYRFVIADSDQGGWEWLAVQAGKYYELTLHADRAKPFDPAATPPPLGFPQWVNPNAPGR